MFKFICEGGHVYSQNDMDEHYISPTAVGELYGIRPAKCIWKKRHIYSETGASETIYLTPDSSGKYDLVDEVVRQINQRIIPKVLNRQITSIENFSFFQRLKFLFTSRLV